MLKFEGMYLLSNSHNPIINNKVGQAFYDTAEKVFIFRLLQALDIEDVGDYVVNAANLSKILEHEVELMQETRIFIDRPNGYTYDNAEAK